MKWTSVAVLVVCGAALVASTKWREDLPVTIALVAVALAILSLHEKD